MGIEHVLEKKILNSISVYALQEGLQDHIKKES